MPNQPAVEFRSTEELSLRGTMRSYGSQDEASRMIPQQWREFLAERPGAGSVERFYGASPCTGDGRIHYLTGVPEGTADVATSGKRLTLTSGEYAVVMVEEAAALRDVWVWLLRTWLPESGRRERNAPEFERFTGFREDGTPVGRVEVWIPLEPAATVL